MKQILKNTAASTLLVTAMLVGFSGSALAGGTAAEAIEAAKGAQKKANSVGGEWRDTTKLIKKAEALLKEGKAEEAKKMAEKAMNQGFLGYEQSKAQTVDKLHI